MAGTDEVLAVQYDRAGPNLTVYLSGELCFDGAEAFADEVIARTGDDVRRLTLDAAELDYCDSGGLDALTRLANHMAELGAEMTVYQAKPVIRKLISLTRLNTVIDVRG